MHLFDVERLLPSDADLLLANPVTGAATKTPSIQVISTDNNRK